MKSDVDDNSLNEHDIPPHYLICPECRYKCRDLSRERYIKEKMELEAKVKQLEMHLNGVELEADIAKDRGKHLENRVHEMTCAMLEFKRVYGHQCKGCKEYDRMICTVFEG